MQAPLGQYDTITIYQIISRSKCLDGAPAAVRPWEPRRPDNGGNNLRRVAVPVNEAERYRVPLVGTAHTAVGPAAVPGESPTVMGKDGGGA
jgi:hypothetical protein